MSTDLAVNPLALAIPEAPVAKYYDEGDFGDMSSGGFMPRLQLCSSNAEIVKEGKIGVAHYAIVSDKETFIDCGREVTVIPLGVRFAAMRFKVKPFIVYYNPADPEFKKVQAESQEKDSQCAYGPQFLVWVPDSNPGCFATFLFGSKSSRKEARVLKPFITGYRAATLKSKLVKNDEFSWHVPVVIPCSQPVTNMPSAERVVAEQQKFANPEASSIEFDPEELERQKAAAAGGAAPAGRPD